MGSLIVRKLLIDLSAPISARWNGEDAFRSAFFNALSMGFPVGEQYFIDSVRAGFKALPEEEQARFKEEVQGFVGQEATHRHIHNLFNGHLKNLGFKNVLEIRAAKRIKRHARLGVLVHVGATAATEHLTSIFAHWTLEHPEAFAGSEKRLQTLWQWHAAEESEHRSTAFDIYKALGGSQRLRVALFQAVTVIFLEDILRQTVRNLWDDKALFKWSSWRSAWQLLMTKDGMFRGNYQAWRAYKESSFHPRDGEEEKGEQWLLANRDQYVHVGAAQ